MRFRLLLTALTAIPAAALAQTDVEWLGRRHGVRPPPAYYEILRRNPNAFQFSPDNGWIRRGQEVARRREAGRAQLAEGVWLTPQANVNANGVLRGTLDVPVLPILFTDTDSLATVGFAPQSALQNTFFSTAAPPYSITTYYREISSDSLEVTGTVQPWRRVSQDDEYYENNENGLTSRTADLLAEIVALSDADLDYGRFDNDGPDGIPNSGDDDGYVDAVVMFHPETDGACRPSSNIWAHKFSYRGWKRAEDVQRGPPYDLATDDDAANNPYGFTKIMVRDYVIQGGQGGSSGCTAGVPPAIGLVTHEIGHIFGLPDLYNTGSSSSHGIGEWGLMGSGNWRTANSPAHMAAWSRAQLGWVTEVVINSDMTLDISPVETADTAYVLPIADSDEYYLLENRQRIGSSDDQMWGPGLLVWHVDSVLVRQRMSSNTLNATDPEAVRLIQADGADDLKAGRDRGDADDPWPGGLGKTEFGITTSPASIQNDSSVTCIEVRQIQGSDPMSAQVAFTVPDLIAATDTLAQFRLDGVLMNRFAHCLESGTPYALEMADTQIVNNGGNRYTWLSWSNGGDISHTFPAGSQGDTIIAEVQTEYLLQVTIPLPNGTVTSDLADVEAGEFVLKDNSVSLEAVPNEGAIWEGWTGDRVSSSTTLALTMTRPFRLTATFATPLLAEDATLRNGLMGSSYSHSLTASGGIETYSWSHVAGSLPAGLQLASNGTITGRPTETGTFAFDARVTSGSQSQTVSLGLEVGMPTVAVADVVSQIVGLGPKLSSDEVRFFDLLGNGNGRLDVGDFLAWVLETGQSVTASEMNAVLRNAEGEGQ